MWLRGHMDLILPTGSGLWGQTSPTGELIQAFHHPRQDGILIFNMKHCHLVLMMVFISVLPHHQTAEEVEVGWEETIFLIPNILYLTVLVHILVHQTSLLLSRLPQQYKKSVLMIMVLQGEVWKVNISFARDIFQIPRTVFILSRQFAGCMHVFSFSTFS